MKDNLKKKIIKEDWEKKLAMFWIDNKGRPPYQDVKTFTQELLSQVREETKKEYQKKLWDLNKRLNKQCEDKVKEILEGKQGKYIVYGKTTKDKHKFRDDPDDIGHWDWCCDECFQGVLEKLPLE